MPLPLFPRLLLPLACLLAAATFDASAIGLDRTFAQLEHTSWTARNGAPDGIGALAQTTDGHLWLGTTQGLYRFDGLRFERVQPVAPARFPDNDVYALHADDDGGLWIGWRLGGISHYRHGAVRNWDGADGTPAGSLSGSVWGFAADGKQLWAAGMGGLARYDGRRWQKLGPDDGFTAQKASAVFVDAQGTVAAFSEQGLFLRPRGEARFRPPVGTLDTRQPPQQQGGGPIYFLEQGGIRVLDSLPAYAARTHPWIYRQRGEVTGSMLADRSGALWYEEEGGLYRHTDPVRAAAPAGAHHAPDTERFTEAQGLSGRFVATLLEDREGNVWVATENGVDRFRETNVVQARLPVERKVFLAGVPGGVLAAGDAGAWRLTANGAPAAVTTARSDDALTGARNGDLWSSTGKRIWRLSGDGQRVLEEFTLPADLKAVGGVHAMAEDAAGTLWVSVVGSGALRRRDGQWQRPVELPREGKKTPLAILADRRGDIWFGYVDNQIARLHDGRVTLYGADQGLALGRVALLAEHEGVLWAGGSDGLARLQGDRFVPVPLAPANADKGLAAASGGPEGLWLTGAAGIVLLPAAELAPSVQGRPLRARVFDEGEGLRGRVGMLDTSVLARGGDGRLWLGTSKGVFRLDPAALRPEPVPAAPVLLRVNADGRGYRPAAALDLPASPQRVTFGFATGAPSMAERIRYRYRLEGYDRDWQPSGVETEAGYTGLPPGDYRFVAQAVNGAGVAGPASAPLAVHVPPTVVQTVWFRAACAAAVLLLVFLFYRYRLRRQAGRLRAHERTRHAERDRIARELHDTLLQSVQGLILRFHAAAARLPAQDPLRASLEQTLVRADAVVAEARDRVQDLRGHAAAGVSLPPLLAAEVALARQEFGCGCEFALRGEPHPVPPDVDYACRRIVAEALRNACRHAEARSIIVHLVYDEEGVHITVADDGRGIDAATLQDGRAGHWGIAGMRERAAEIGARLEIRSEAGQGTRLSLHLSDDMAEFVSRNGVDPKVGHELDSHRLRRTSAGIA